MRCVAVAATKTVLFVGRLGTWTADERMCRLRGCDWSGARMAGSASAARLQWLSLVRIRLSSPRTLLLTAPTSILSPSPVPFFCFLFLNLSVLEISRYGRDHLSDHLRGARRLELYFDRRFAGHFYGERFIVLAEH